LASTFFVSPFEEAAVCAIDGFSDFVSTSLAVGRGTRLDIFEKVYFPHSLGLVYLALTPYLGFLKYGDEFKVMGLPRMGAPTTWRRFGSSSTSSPEAASNSTFPASATGRMARA
jgi:carbamoyltransferase